MGRKSRPVKIKRYKNSMGKKGISSEKAKKIILLLLCAVLIVGMGYFLGRPVVSFLSNIGKSGGSSSQITASSENISQSVPNSSSISSFVSSSQISDDSMQSNVAVKNRVYYYVSANMLSSETGIDNVIKQMKDKGANYCVFDLKDSSGYVLFNSENEYAKKLLSKTIIDLDMVVEKFSANGIVPVARIYTFMDQMISTVERSTAVMYDGTDTRWLDSSAALGGKAWANPASKIMQDYIISLTDEILAHGIKEIIFAGFQTPTGYSLDKRDFGVSEKQLLADMKNLITTLKSKISAKGGYSAWQFEYSAVAEGGSYAQYIVHPYQLGTENIILTAKGSDIDTDTAVENLKKVDEDDVSSIVLWLTDGKNSDATKTMNSYFAF